MKLADATILVVDDEPELLEIFSVWLGRSGCKVLKAENGAVAMKVLNEQRIDALISDIRMPVMDGITLVRTIAEKGMLVPSIIFVSGFGDVDTREAHALGVEAMLPKPLSRKTLLQALEDSLKAREELWHTPLETPPAKSLHLTLPAFETCNGNCSFQIGRGGCCFATDESFDEDTLLQLTVEFTGEPNILDAQARVRWCDTKDSRMGVEFLYLAPECRDWVISHMTGRAMHTFIPRC
ncbi:PilZ domain-containing protein [Granulicella rosea]|uniref:PilZ domain-containing protein n=1 Tax=Granulicella rosea TaxID=474952 RepID=A0A239EYP4_9BACT|nr:response regulator [Granulicella rosea]SNS49153.1 PilZ domain-containing protein [Granulicella rosea]